MASPGWPLLTLSIPRRNAATSDAVHLRFGRSRSTVCPAGGIPRLVFGKTSLQKEMGPSILHYCGSETSESVLDCLRRKQDMETVLQKRTLGIRA